MSLDTKNSINNILEEKRLFPPSKDFSEKSNIKSFEELQKLKKLSLEKDLLNYITRPQGHNWLSGEVFITEQGLNKRKQVVNLIDNKKFSRVYFD